ncbi:Cytochrome c554 and c-prime [Fontimonas thermophila]|uniref:Cytochrome c554 and c-prime n=2 Tax=Fontimonas thermophila TaxID=1076937 RepID=A0A1I2I9P0_9GAMM|nr:Cytochrome c554 and c-prime [Fontimonas thermophila]
MLGCFVAVCALTFAQGLVSAGDRHEGVASCAGSTCHGATRPFGDVPIRQDEYFIWQQKDAHARAYAVLLGERAQRIGRHLGIRPHEAPQCLVCHADYPAPELRGERYLVSDGVGCEACHGGAGRWLAEHTRAGISAEEKQQRGMTPLWKPEVRSRVCLQCHQGDAQHPITHAMMAAGHPPLLFELYTFTGLSPPHYDWDDDYARRKSAPDAVRDWAVGQMVAAQVFLTELASGRLGQGGVFPELMYFDCNTCHHSLDAGRWTPGRTGPLPPGAPPLADTHLHWVGVWLDVVAPALADRWHRHWLGLQSAMASGPAAVRAAAAAMLGLLEREILPLGLDRRLDAGQLRALLQAIAALPHTPRARDFSSAEQAAMAALVFAGALQARGERPGPTLDRAIDALYAAVRSRDRFDPAQYHAALAELQRALR